MVREPLGLNPELRTPQLLATHVRAGTGLRTLARNYTISTSDPPFSAIHSIRAPSCRTPPQNRPCPFPSNRLKQALEALVLVLSLCPIAVDLAMTLGMYEMLSDAVARLLPQRGDRTFAKPLPRRREPGLPLAWVLGLVVGM
jgi:hypothetical protein